MLPYFRQGFANAGSITHTAGRTAAEAVANSRSTVAQLINGESREIIFTSGATESNNIAIFGVVNFLKKPIQHIITTAIEHPSVLECCGVLEKSGHQLSILEVNSKGLIDLENLKATLRENTSLVTIGMANNEIGTVQNIEAISKIVHTHASFLHVDAAQALGKVKIDVKKMGIDLLSISGHKMYAPKGVGALYLSRKSPRVRLAQHTFGGHQELGYRPGTLNVPGIVGLAKACKIIIENNYSDAKRMHELSDKIFNTLIAAFPALILNGPNENRLPGNLNCRLPGLNAENFICKLPHIAMSLGSACSSNIPMPSHVLKAIGLKNEDCESSFRLSTGRFTTEEDIEKACTEISIALTDTLNNNVS